MKKINKSTWLPIVLFIYFLGMALYFGPELIKKGETLRFITVSVVEIAVIILARIFYKRRERNQNNR